MYLKRILPVAAPFPAMYPEQTDWLQNIKSQIGQNKISGTLKPIFKIIIWTLSSHYIYTQHVIF